ncbi:MAG: hypothetical protein R3B90_19660 [Planctomycetaceae bacterium]
MAVVSVRCPSCSARLRLQDASYVGRTIDCPDCRQPLEFVRNAVGEIECVAGKGPPKASAARLPSDLDVGDDGLREPATTASQQPAATSASAATFAQRDKSPVSARVIGWGVAVVLLGVLLATSLWRPDTDGNENAGSSANAGADAAGPAADRPQPPVAPDGATVTPRDVPAPERVVDESPVGRQLTGMAGWVMNYRERHGVYPYVNPEAMPQDANQRLGWLAVLVADQQPGGPTPLWDRGYADPLNAKFVRRKLPLYLNPALAEPAAEGFPATHYVGMAGVGADAATLEKGHPRAGVFGVHRVTRVEDIRDGLANTLLVVGTEKQLAPWASGGARTIRGLVREPYINGPDGFGTGQPDGMFVAMADGSVRFLSSETEPTVMRRMAAMADGLPLDSAVPGEPGAVPTSPDPAVPHVANGHGAVQPVEPARPPNEHRPTDGPPITPPMVADPQPRPPVEYDIEQALGQRITRFAQVRPAKFLDLIRQIEEMAAIPISTREIAEGPLSGRLDREVSVELRDTTVGELLDALLAKVDLRYESGRDFGIRIKAP